MYLCSLQIWTPFQELYAAVIDFVSNLTALDISFVHLSKATQDIIQWSYIFIKPFDLLRSDSTQVFFRVMYLCSLQLWTPFVKLYEAVKDFAYGLTVLDIPFGELSEARQYHTQCCNRYIQPFDLVRQLPTTLFCKSYVFMFTLALDPFW